MSQPDVLLGIDLGGTKIAGVALGADGTVLAQTRRPTPRSDYPATIAAVVKVVGALEERASLPKGAVPVGIGIPGSISPHTGRVQNANSTWLNDRPLHQDLEAALGRPVRLANDANCFALSEAMDGAGASHRIVFGVIMGTGCGGAIVADGQLIEGRHRIGGEWGHTPLPWMTAAEFPGPRCWCGRQGCIETYISGTGLAADHHAVTGVMTSGEDIVAVARRGDGQAAATLNRHADRAARALAMITNILDPDVIVLGGGLSQLGHLYDVLPGMMAHHIFADHARPLVLPPRHGDASGARGAARLWQPPPAG